MTETLTVIQYVDTIPVSKLFWNMIARNNLICISLRTLVGSRSGIDALLGFILNRRFTTPSLVTSISGIDGNGVPSGDDMLFLSS